MRFLSRQLIILLILTAHTSLAQNPTSANDFSQRGIARFEKNDLAGAIEDFTKAIELKGQNLEFCFYFRGLSLYRLGKLDEAVADLTSAISIKQHSRFFDDRGNLLAQKGDLDGAIADLDQAIQIEPKYAKAYGDRGIVRLLRGEDAASEIDFNKCFELDATLESHFKEAASKLRHQAVLKNDRVPVDVEIMKFNWSEAPLVTTGAVPSPTFPQSKTGASPTGLQVLGDATRGDPGGSSTLDPAASGQPTRDTTRTRGVYYKFNASVKNTGTKTVTVIEWAYVFYPKDPKDRSNSQAYTFATKVNIPPGKQKDLTDQVRSYVNSKISSKQHKELFEERVVILRLEYADGSSWKR